MTARRFLAALATLGCLASLFAPTPASASALPPQPTDVAATLGTFIGGNMDHDAEITWTQISGYNADITTYENGQRTSVQNGYSDASFTTPPLDPDATYSFTVAFVDIASGQVGPASDPTTPITVPPDPPYAVGYGFGYTYGSDWVRVHWTTPNDGGSPITGYQVSTDFAGSVPSGTPPPPKPVSVGASANSARISGLVPGVEYAFGIAATNAAGQSTRWENDITPGPNLPGPVPYVHAREIDYNTVRVSWHPPVTPKGPDQQPAIESYAVYGRRDGHVASATVDADSTSVVLHGVHAAGLWQFEVTATNALGTGGSVVKSNAIFVDDPAQPPKLTTHAGQGLVSVRWNGAYDTGNGSDPGYVLVVSGDGQTQARDVPNRAERTIRGLTNGVRYTVTIGTQQVDGSPLSISETATPRVLTELTGIRAARSGSRVAVRVRLLRADNSQPVAHQKVRLEYRNVGHPDFHVWRTRERTASDGVARFSGFHAVHHVYVRVVAPPAGRFGRSVSRTVTPAV